MPRKEEEIMKKSIYTITMIMIAAMILCLAITPAAICEECGIGTAASRITETEETTIPYATEYITDTTMTPGSGTRVIQAGKNGVKTVTYLVDYEDGVERARGMEDVTIIDPINEIIGVAPKPEDVVTKEETKTETIYYKTETVNDPDRIKGEADQVIQEGKNGSREVVYTVVYMNGKEINRSEKSSRVITPAVNKIVSVATGEYDLSYETETVTIPYTTIYKDADNWYVGEESVDQEGQNGEKEVTYAVYKDKNGNEVSRSVSSEKITKNVTNKIIYRGTFVPEYTYEVVAVPDLPECKPERRTSDLDTACAEWAMVMARNDHVTHSDHDWGESVGAWGSIDAVVNGRDYTVISTQDGNTYSGNVSLGSHGGEMLATGREWGAGCVARTETLPGGGTRTIYYACARSN